ncbi:condensation domain-containing protein, partial [Ideonella azotifigens]
AMPLTANGKVDRKALPAPDMSQSEVAYLAPRTENALKLAAVWKDVLKVEQVGLGDNFFDLGGHSLLATQLMSRVNAAFGTEISLRAIFEAPTLGEMVQLVAPDEAEPTAEPTAVPAAVPAAVPSAPAETSEGHPLSFAQQRLWFLDQLERHSPLYNIPAAVRLTGKLDHEALAFAFNAVIGRHDALRAYFESTGGMPVQKILPRLEVTLALNDLRDLPRMEREARMQWLMLDQARTPFDLQTGPLVRGGLLQLGDEEHLLLLTMHHIVSDGWSMGILVREVGVLYAGRAMGATAALPELPMRYVDFARWQRQWLAGEVLAQQLAYWRQQLAGSPQLLALPTDRPRPAVQSQSGASVAYAVPAEVHAKLLALGRKRQSTLFMTLCAAFNVLLARQAGQTDICIGTPIANRNRAEIEGLIGLFVNTLVLRTQVDLGLGFNALLAQVRGHTLDAYANQDVQFEQLVEALQPERDSSFTPLFQVMLVLQNAPMKLELPGLQLAFVPGERVTAKF